MAEKTILVVDTDIKTINKIATTLESEGFLVLKASNKDSGLYAARTIKPSVIFINIGIIGASGLEMCEKIHADKTLNHIPIVIITPQEGAIDFQDSVRYGRVDVLNKSFTTEELITKTNTVFTRNSITLQHGDEKALEHTIDFDIEGKRLDEQSVEGKPISIKNEKRQFEEYVIAQPIEEQNEVYLSDEYSANKESPDEKEEKHGIQHTDKESASFGIWMEGWEEQGGKHTVKGVNEQTKWNYFSDEAPPFQHQDKPLPKKSIGKNKRIGFLVLLVLMIGIVGFGGFLLYGNFIQIKNLPSTKDKSSSPQAQGEIPSLQHPNEIQRAQDIEEHKPAELTAVETKPEAKPLYAIQIGAFKVEANAQFFRKQYQEKGYDANIKKIKTKDNKIFYKIFIGSFENRKEAIEAARSISTKEKIQTTILRR
jgi:DNA-binding response OmpR family regulator